ncbi:hypothetical protein L810_7174 [Burkholderia sp. AU4i]|nr:hypothetical protein L810_7174 [Burkholderia sp. AU4i]
MPADTPPMFSQPRQKPPIVNGALRLSPFDPASLASATAPRSGTIHRDPGARSPVHDRGRPPDYRRPS